MSNYRDNNSIIENFDIGQIDEQTEILKEKYGDLFTYG